MIYVHYPVSISTYSYNVVFFSFFTRQYVTFNFELIVKWNGEYNVDVWLSNSFSNTVQGLCGNLNQDPTDDFMDPNGNVVNIILLEYLFYLGIPRIAL